MSVSVICVSWFTDLVYGVAVIVITLLVWRISVNPSHIHEKARDIQRIFSKLKFFYCQMHRVRLGTEIIRTRQRKATWHNMTYKYSEQVYTYDKLTYNIINLQNIKKNKR